MKHLKFVGLKVSEISFKAHNDFLTGGEFFKINPKIRMDLNQTPTNMMLTVTVTIDKHLDAAPPFELNLVMQSSFQIESFGDLNIMRLEATEFTFPYVRAAVSQITSTVGLPAFIMPVIDFSAPQNNMQQQPNTPFQAPPQKPKQNDSIIITPLDVDI